MNEKEIESRIKFLETSLRKTEDELERIKILVPDGTKLRSIKYGSEYQYFMRKDGLGSNGEYIKKRDRKTAEVLAQIEYDEKLSAILKKNMSDLVKHKSALTEDPFATALNKMALGKRILVKPFYVSDEEFIMNWKNQTYEGVPFKDDYPEFYTRQGLRVRSKSEVIIADILDELSIPFLYEKPLQLKSGTTHPDFTLLNLRERRERIWEHFGMMDDADYRNNAFNKIRNYESSGFYQHDSLIWTFETGKHPLNTKEIRRMILGLKRSLGYD